MRILGDQCAAIHGTQVMLQLFANSLATMVTFQALNKYMLTCDFLFRHISCIFQCILRSKCVTNLVDWSGMHWK